MTQDVNLYRGGADILQTDDTVKSSGSYIKYLLIGSDPTYGDFFRIQRTGYMSWGAGAGVYDITLYRSAADVLKTDDNLDALALRIGGTEVLTSGRVLQNIASFAQHWVPDGADTRNIGSTTAEILNLYMGDSGRIYFGTAQDVDLYRSAADILKTDDTFDALALKIGGTEVISSARLLQNVTLSTLLPDADITYDLGSIAKRFLTLYVRDLKTPQVASVANRIDILSWDGSAYKTSLRVYSGGMELSNLTYAVPKVTDTYNLGSPTLTWLNVYLGDAGKLFFGLTQDVNLYRSAADILKTDDNFDALALRIGATEVIDSSRNAKNLVQITCSDRIAVVRGASTNDVLLVLVSGDTMARLRMEASGKIEWGPGGLSSLDTNLYRSATDQLKTDDDFVIANGKKLLWSDVNLYRSVADVLKTDDNFDALALRIGGTSVITSARKLQSIASVLQDLVPDATDTYRLGSSTLYWLSAYATNVFSALVRPAGGDNTGNIGLSTVRWSRADIVKIYGTVGDPEPLPKPLRGLEDLMNVEFRTDGLPIEATLPTRYIPPKEEVRKHLREEKIKMREAGESSEEVEPAPEEIDVVYKRLEDTVNLCHTIGWLIQCVYELNEKVEKLEANIGIPR